jgi:hypothetical protein
MRILVAGMLALLCACGDSRGNCPAVVCEPAQLAHVINITVTDARGTPLTAIPTITVLVVPAGAAILRASCSLPDAGPPACFIDTGGSVAGHYEFDIGAAGYQPQHLKADVAARPTRADCCPLPSYVPVDLTVALSS